MPPTHTSYGSGPSPRAVFFARLLLPAALLWAAFIRPSLPSAVYLLSFLAMHACPPHGTRTRFPYSSIFLLIAYSIILIALHIALAALVARDELLPDKDNLERATAVFDAFSVPRYDISAWQGVRSLLGPLIVLIACLMSFLQPHHPSGKTYIVRSVMLIRVCWAAATRYRALRKQLKLYALAISSGTDPFRELYSSAQNPTALHANAAHSDVASSNNQQSFADSTMVRFTDQPNRPDLCTSFAVDDSANESRTHASQTACVAPLPMPSPCTSPRNNLMSGLSTLNFLQIASGGTRRQSEESPISCAFLQKLFPCATKKQAVPAGLCTAEQSYEVFSKRGDPWPAGFMTLEAIEDVVSDTAVIDNEHVKDADVILERLVAHGESSLRQRYSQFLSTCDPDTLTRGRQYFQRGLAMPAHLYRSTSYGGRASFGSDEKARMLLYQICNDDVNQEPSCSEAAASLHGRHGDVSSKAMPTKHSGHGFSSTSNKPDQAPSRMTFFLATHGGLYWSVASCGLAASSYSSLFTFLFMLAVLITTVAWAFGRIDVFAVVRRRHPISPRLLFAFRAYIFWYIILVYVFQLALLDDLRSSELASFIGLVQLDTSVEQGWAHIMAAGAAISAFVTIGMYRMAVRVVLQVSIPQSDVEDQHPKDLDIVTEDRTVEGRRDDCRQVLDSDGHAETGVFSETFEEKHGMTPSSSTAADSGTGHPSQDERTRLVHNIRGVSASQKMDFSEDTGSIRRNEDRRDSDPLSASRDGLTSMEVVLPSQELKSVSDCESLTRPYLKWSTVVVSHGIVLLSSLGMLSWALVFPGVFTFPLLFAVFAGFLSYKWRLARSLDIIIFYTAALQLVFYLYTAATDAFGLRDSGVARLLSFRRFKPQFVMNILQLLAVVLFCVGVRARRYLERVREDQTKGVPGVDELVHLSTYTAKWHQKLSAASPVTVLVDQLALASLYVTGGSNPSALNAVFMFALAIICILQATGFGHHRSALSILWIGLLLYSACFVLMNGAFCRAGAALWTCEKKVVGLVTASTSQTVAYAVTAVFAAVQVQVTWRRGKHNRDSSHVSEFRSRFWVFLRGYFILFVYGALLLYPLTFPANFLSYVYMVFLLLCVLVEILAPRYGIWGSSPGSGRIVRGYWFAIVLFSSFALLARYFLRFPRFDSAPYAKLWVFGLERGISGFVLTLGDAIVLILLSLQGRLLLLNKLLSRNDSSIESEYSAASLEETDSALQKEVPQRESDAGKVHGSQTSIAEEGSLERASSEQGDLQPTLRRARATIFEGRLRSSGMNESDDGVPRSQGPWLPAGDIVRNLRKSLPVKRTEMLFNKILGYIAWFIRRMLLEYNYVFESLAILIAAVWLDGITVFGAIYLVIGCLLMTSTHRIQEVHEARNVEGTSDELSLSTGQEHVPLLVASQFDQLLPPLLAILSFLLMSVQYLYIILSSSGEQWGAIAEYIGFQAVPETVLSRQTFLVPITQHAMIAHVLVFFMAFLQKASVRWKVSDGKRAALERLEQERFQRPVPSALQSTEALATAVSVSTVIPGVGGSSLSFGNVVASGQAQDGSSRVQVRFVDETEGGHDRSALEQVAEPWEIRSNGAFGDRVGFDRSLQKSVSFHSEHRSREVAPKVRASQTFTASSRRGKGHDPVAQARNIASAAEDNVGIESVIPRKSTGRREWEHISDILFRRESLGHSSSFHSGDSTRASELHDSRGLFASSSDACSEQIDTVQLTVENEISPVSDAGNSTQRRDQNSVTQLQKLRNVLLSTASTVWSRTAEALQLLVPFWKNWGFDVTLAYLVIGAAVTRTVFSVLYIVLVLAVGRLQRNHVARHWRLIAITLVILVLSQYLLSLGFPPREDADSVIGDPLGKLSRAWSEWLYLDSLTARTSYVPGSSKRKLGITFGFLGVICAGITLNSLSEGSEELKTGVHGFRGSSASTSSQVLGTGTRENAPIMFARAKNPLQSSATAQEYPARSLRSAEGNPPSEVGNAEASTLCDSQQENVTDEFDRKIANKENDGIFSASVRQVNASSSVSSSKIAEDREGLKSKRLFSDSLRRHSSRTKKSKRRSDTGSDDATNDETDFTRRPLSFANWVKLSWMRFAASAVQLVLFGIASFDTNLMSAILLVMSLYFFVQFTNFRVKQSRFRIVRSYVLVAILILVTYQAPFSPESDNWPNILGLYKTDSGNRLLYLLVVLWLFCQMQIRIYESSDFKFVVKCIEEEEKVRWHRAVHEHHDRMYEKMLGRNKNQRAKAARQARVNALETLRHESEAPPTELLYKVCVTNWIAVLKARANSSELKELKANLKKEKEEEEKNAKNITARERFARLLIRGRNWRKHAKRPFAHELRLFILRYSSWPVYFTMILAAVVAPSIFTLVYPIVLFLYLVLEQPRPPKQAWTTLILYVYAVIIVKYVGRKGEVVACTPSVPFVATSGLSPTSSAQPGVKNTHMCSMASGIFFDILVLLALLWHRALLYYRGLWDLPQSEEELRLRKDVKCTAITTPDDMTFDASFTPLATSILTDDVTTENDSGHIPHNYISAVDQYRLAESALLRGQREISGLASSVQDGPETWDSGMLASANDEPESSSHVVAKPKNVSRTSPTLSRPNRKDARFSDASGSRDQVLAHERSDSHRRSFTRLDGSLDRTRSSRDTVQSSTDSIGLDGQNYPSLSHPDRFAFSRDFGNGLGSHLRHRRTVVSRTGARDGDGIGLRRNSQRGDGGDLSRDASVIRSLSVRASDDQGQIASESVVNSLLRRSTTRRIFSGLPSENNRSQEVSPVEPPSIVEQSLVAGNVLQPRPESAAKDSEAGERIRSFSAVRPDNPPPNGPVGFLKQHFRRLLKPNEHKTVGDYYLLIFTIDFICFVYMTFGYSFIFGRQSQELKTNTWWSNNFIETKHLLSLLAMFSGIVIDRIVYLRRSILGKLALQYVSVFVYHYVLFIGTNIGTRGAAKAFYSLKCLYFLVSGLQIRMGFPLYTTGQFLLRNYSTLGLVLFEIYNYIPFLWLMRTLLDWAVLETSLEIFQYFRFIDIYLWLYRNRAINVSRGLFRRKLGQKRRPLPRIYQGAGLFLLCAFLLFFPFFVFSFLNPFFKSRNLVESSLSVDFVSGNETFRAYKRSVLIGSALSSSKPDQEVVRGFEKKYSVMAVLREKEHLFFAKFDAPSEQLWLPSSPDSGNLVKSLLRNSSSPQYSVPKLSFTLTSMTTTQVFRITESVDLSDNQTRSIAESLQSLSSTSILLKSPLPRYLVLPSGSGTFQAAENNDHNKGTCMGLAFENNSSLLKSPFWFVKDCLGDSCDCRAEDIRTVKNMSDMFSKQSSVQVFLQVADVSALQFGGGTILTVYVAILFTVASIAKSFMSNKRLIIPYIDMPYTLHLYQLVVDIVYARQDKDLVMEEILYNGLVDIYRDPHELAKWSGQRALKVPREWWLDEQEQIEGYGGWPSFRETETEPYMERLIDGENG